jgi:hypothetical protein
MNFDPLQNDRKQSSQLDDPIAISPQGNPIFDFEHLPYMPIPQIVRVKADQMEIDGWIFRYIELRRGTLLFFRNTVQRWKKEDDSKENLEWMAKIFEAFYCASSEKISPENRS